jgi:cell division protein FtsQ
MNTKATIRKILFVMLWVCIGGGMLSLLIAAIGKKKREDCAGYTIAIKNSEDKLFIDANDIRKLLKVGAGAEIKGKQISQINLKKLEQLLRDNVWVRKAEMWFDNKNVLHVEVYEREPVARIFTTGGRSFYIDSTEKKLPLSDKLSARVPVFTGFVDKKVYSAKDSLLLSDIKNIAIYIKNDPFWMSQVAQVNITAERNFELSPVVGNHLIKLGSGKDLEKKFGRLMIFYQQVLAQKGFDAYSTVDVQYSGQVVGTRRGTEKNKVDTVMLRRRVDEMLKQMQKQYDSVAALKPLTVRMDSFGEKPTISGSQVSTNDLRATSTQSTNPNALKAESLPLKKQNKPNEDKPRAVMPKKSQ